MFQSAAFKLQGLLFYVDDLAAVFRETITTRRVNDVTRNDYARWLATYDGSIVEFDRSTDFNALFGELYAAIREYRLDHDRRLPGAFQKMAGLLKSATIEYHRRAMGPIGQ
jgi:hypothetical protein